MVFWFCAWKRPAITSALYPYVHMRASGISETSQSSGQKTPVCKGEEEDEACFGFAVEVESRCFDRLKNDRPLLGLVGFAVGTSDCHVVRGCPRRP